MNKKEFYEKYWNLGGQIVGEQLFWKQNLLKKYIGAKKHILDVGCGDGRTSSVLVEYNDVWGVDISSLALKEASRKGLKTKLYNIEKGLPFKSRRFDVVLLMDVLEHTINPEYILNESRRVLKTNGTIIICVPNSLNLLNRLYFLFGKPVDITDRFHIGDSIFSDHIRFFSKELLEKLIQDGGLEYINREYFFPKNFHEERWKKLRIFGKIVRWLKLYKKLPSLFSLSFFYVCKFHKGDESVSNNSLRIT